MIAWIVNLWTSSFVKVIVLEKYKILVNIDYGGYMLFWTLVLILAGIGLGVAGTVTVVKIFKK